MLNVLDRWPLATYPSYPKEQLVSPGVQIADLHRTCFQHYLFNWSMVPSRSVTMHRPALSHSWRARKSLSLDITIRQSFSLGAPISRLTQAHGVASGLPKMHFFFPSVYSEETKLSNPLKGSSRRRLKVTAYPSFFFKKNWDRHNVTNPKKPERKCIQWK